MLNPLNLFHIDYEYKITNILYQHWFDNSFSYKKTPRPDYGILFVMEGKFIFETEHNTIAATSGDIVLLPKHAKYRAVFLRKDGNIYDYLINFEINGYEANETPLLPQIILKNAGTKYISLFETLTKDYISDTADFRTKANFYFLLSYLKNDILTFGSTKQYDMLAEAKKMLTAKDELSIKEVARRCSISESGLRSKFVQAFGISPVKYRTMTKMNKAKYLLQSTDMQSKEIADMLHFFDEAYFCKTFCKYVGCTPKEYRKNKQL